MTEDLEVLKQHAESLGFETRDRTRSLSEKDLEDFAESLDESDEIGLANYVRGMSKQELSELVFFTLFEE